MDNLKNYINGNFVDSNSNQFNDFMNPALDEPIGKVPISTKDEVDEVVKVAKEAFKKWRKVPGIERIQPFLRLLTIFKENIEELTELIVINHGKEWNAAKGEIIRTYQMIEASLAVPEYQKGQYMSNIAEGIDEYTILEPMGVFIMIPPFNFPTLVPFWFMPFAVAAGNAYIIKSNEQAPLAMQKIFKLIDKAGFPPGVINFIHGNVDTANHLIEHPDVVGVSSVGSTPVAREIYKKASSLCKRAQCHGGANNFLVITENANIEKIMPNLMNSFFGNTGQRCLSGAIAMIVGKQSFYETFREKFLEEIKALKVGYGMDKDSFMGPVISKKSLNNLKEQIENGIEGGAKLILDGRDIRVPGYEKGYFLGPCVFEKAKPGMKLYDEEVFGPVACLDRVDSLEEAIKIINDNPKGNAVTIYTESGEEARKFRGEIHSIQTGINIGVVAPLAWFPFAGAKDSFFGTLRAQGYEVIKFFTQERVIIERFHGSGIPWD
ncbi:MAG: CoA-acylating methylmalonate-semialdehyde dehydrogenase [Candidatus Lokiarchaeota archaeon]|nr:CoA-acylating methylmalonate-semialdehyde dehydrogenase [Candidatus Lokiarchaeota archaeon]